MNYKLLCIILLHNFNIVTPKNATPKPSDVNIKKSLEEHQFQYTFSAINKSKTKSGPARITNVKLEQPGKPIVANKTHVPVMIPPDFCFSNNKRREEIFEFSLMNYYSVYSESAVELANYDDECCYYMYVYANRVQTWAEKISEKLLLNERKVVRKDILVNSYSDVKYDVRNGSAIVEEAAKALEELLIRRSKAAEAIMRKAEELAVHRTNVPYGYTFNHSIDLDMLKAPMPTVSKCELPLRCRSLNKVKLDRSKHFDGMVSLEATSVYVAAEVFDCDPQVTKHLYWSEELLRTFRENYAQDSTLGFQYLCSAKGFLRHFPAASWQSMYQLSTEGEDLYDCRLRPWYVSASGAPRDVLILLDASGSMNGSSNAYVAEQFALALLNALTDDDKVNVLGFNVAVESPVSCFNDKLVSANHVNTAAMMAALKNQKMVNETWMDRVLKYAVHLLQEQRGSPERPPACQQAIVLVTDSLYGNYTQLLRELDPEGRIRLFVLWLHDPYGLRDDTRTLGQWLSCVRDGYFAEFISPSDVTEQVINILRVLERPLVGQRSRRMTVYSDVYAHVEDPRRAEFYWQEKEKAEQAFRYGELRRNKNDMFNDSLLYLNFMQMTSLEKNGYYNEDENVNYRLQVSVSVPVFDSIKIENITIKLDEEKQRNSTRTYPVNRLLGVAGVDIPIDHLKLIFSYYQLGPGSTLFLLDHRGNIVFHENVKPVYDGDVLKPGYRTVDFLDLEQPAGEHLPRHYPRDWLEFRKAVIIHESAGNRTMYSKHIFKDGLRATLEMREYYWKRVLDHYTIVAVLPMHSRRHAAPQATFTQELAAAAWTTLNNTNFSVNPDWLYCRHVERHFENPDKEVLHFLQRRRDESNFAMQKLKHLYSPIPPSLIEKPYQCNEKLMARLCKDAVATEQWMQDHEDPVIDGSLGSVIAFFATESGLTRRQVYHASSPDMDLPHGATWPRGPAESWYARAAAATTLLVHVPVAPVRVMRNSDVAPKQLDITYQWLTAARALAHPTKGTIGVAGFHFHQRYMNDLLSSITNFPCEEVDKSKCDPRCDGGEWTCIVVDEGGWVVAGGQAPRRSPRETPAREHLAAVHPVAMAALLDAGVFKLNWIHDYQGVCFTENKAVSTIATSWWSTTILMMFVSQELAAIFGLLGTSVLVEADTRKEREKRWKRLQRDFERERSEREYERMMDPRIFVRRTRVAACDRSRALYVLQRTSKAMEALRQPARPCGWPLTGAALPDTNLLLLAVYNGCAGTARPLPDPLINSQVNLSDSEWSDEDPASRLACWRHRVSLPTRPPRTPCFPHNYSFEAGYRQCGEWLPDPEKEGGEETHDEPGYTLCGKWIPLPQQKDGVVRHRVWFMLLLNSVIINVFLNLL